MLALHVSQPGGYFGRNCHSMQYPFKHTTLCAAGAVSATGGSEVHLLLQQAGGAGMVPALRRGHVLPGPPLPPRQGCCAGHPSACVSELANQVIYVD